MITILIVLTWIAGYAAGPTIAMQEFSNPDRCEDARKAVTDEFTAWSVTKEKFRAFCVPK
jgi:hypothetical protein